VLDGGMGDELRHRFPDKPWSPYALESHAADVVATHCEYIYAGAQVLETWNYSVTPYWLRGYHPSEMKDADAATMAKTFEELTRTSVRLAKQARELSGTPHVRIAGALPPMGATFDAQEPIMDGSTGLPIDTYEFYLAQARILASEGVDLFLIETCASISFATAAIKACRAVDPDMELWIAFTLRHTAPVLCSGETVPDAIAANSSLSCRKVDALLFNCCPAEVISRAIEIARPLYDGHLGGYGNRRSERKTYGIEQAAKQSKSGAVHLGGDRIDLNPEGYAQWCEDWIAKGADIVGGCCQVGPKHIAAVSRMVDNLAADNAGNNGTIRGPSEQGITDLTMKVLGVPITNVCAPDTLSLFQI